ncbi:MAG: type II toxin-antitoxin system mRNA interferase toxin, RelE/StbE family [Bacteroidota bacterium]|nr:type II toxin-antitoxin system mRNA interferase toxin, RelE/StbE family [Bacteroidota bacterium]
MIIRVSSKFKRVYKKLPHMVKVKAKEQEAIFRADPFDTRLETHKLHGKYKEYWAFTVVGQYRIMFAFTEKEIVDFINIGTHDIYR